MRFGVRDTRGLTRDKGTVQDDTRATRAWEKGLVNAALCGLLTPQKAAWKTNQTRQLGGDSSKRKERIIGNTANHIVYCTKLI